METNFFTQICGLKLTGNIRLNIQLLEDGTMAVSILLINDALKDKAAKQIPPLLLKGSSEELDSKFFETITTPLQKTNGLLRNLNEHEQALKNAQNSSHSKTNSGAGNKDKEAKRKRFDDQMKKVNDLEKLNRIGEAIGQMPDPKNHPDFEEEIKTRIAQLRTKHAGLSLFADLAENQPEVVEANEEENQDFDDDFIEDDDELDPNK